MQAIQYLFVTLAIIYLGLGLAMAAYRGNLRARIARMEAAGANSRAGKGSYLYQYLRFRLTPGAPIGLLIAIGTVVLVGYATVYVLINNLPLLGAVVIQGYLIFAGVDSIEALFFTRFFSKAPPGEVGRLELGQAHWAEARMNRGGIYFILLGAAMVALSFVSVQLVDGGEVALAAYVGAVFMITGIFPFPVSVVLAALIYAATAVGAAWVERRTLNIMSPPKASAGAP